VSVGYTPAGVELWNAMRGLDYLVSRPEVDRARLGVTGRSGGGATSWWIAAADDRPACIIPVAGIADLYSHLIEGEAEIYKKSGVIAGHCDCMYMVNKHQWDFPLVAALCAPRPLLLGNSDADAIFPVGGYRRLAAKVRPIYELYGAGEKFQLLETAGPHKDTPELRLGAFRWLNHWLKHDDGPVVEPVREPFTPQQLRVFERLPTDARNARIDESFVKRESFEPPLDAEMWLQLQRLQPNVLQHLFQWRWTTIAGPIEVRAAADVSVDGLRLRAFDFISEEDVPLRLWLATAAKVEKPKLVVLTAVDEARWQEWLKELGPAFAAAFPGTTMPQRDPARFEQTRKALAFNKWAFATFAPRGIGQTRWAEPGSKADTLVRRKYALIGQTLDGQRVWDVFRAVRALAENKDLAGVPLWLQGHGEMAGIVLHAALFTPEIKQVELWHPPASYRQGPTFLDVQRFFDMPQVVALLLSEKPVNIYVKDEAEAKAWDFAVRADALLGSKSLKIRQVGD